MAVSSGVASRSRVAGPMPKPRLWRQAGKAARGATAYVTLEPCAHHGKTPPCAEALVAAGIKRCVIATGDPDPRVAGGGTAILKAAGIEILEGVLGEDARELNAGFFMRLALGRPLVTLKLATSFDGKIATLSRREQMDHRPGGAGPRSSAARQP